MVLYMLTTLLLLTIGGWYAYYVVVKPLDRTWLEVVIGVGITVPGIVAFLVVNIVSFMRVDWNVPLSVMIAAMVLSVIVPFAITGSSQILAQEVKRARDEHHHQITKGSIRDTRGDWQKSAHETQAVAQDEEGTEG